MAGFRILRELWQRRVSRFAAGSNVTVVASMTIRIAAHG
jgi:hypothetical protein